MKQKVMAAMSGGVDSSVTALLLINQGYDVTGITLKLFYNEDIGLDKDSSCCSLEDVEDARAVALRLGIPYNVLNFSDSFRENVINRFIDAYSSGRTPNPCIDCNRFVKFGKLIQRAKLLDFEYVATGHYAQIEHDKTSNRFLLKKAVDLTKDQSYVLYSLTQDQLAHTLFPLGSMTKGEVRKIALENGFVNAKKRDSQDICFAPDGDYAEFVTRNSGRQFPEGDFVSTDGTVLGKHKGIIRYTMGQRRGLGVSADRRLFVTDIIPSENKIVLGDNEDLFSRSLEASDINLITTDKITSPLRVKAKVRYRHTEQPAIVEQVGEDRLHVEFEKGQRAITKGQAVVLYDGEYVVGGGTIC